MEREDGKLYKQIVVSPAVWVRVKIASQRILDNEGVQILAGNILKDWVKDNADKVALPELEGE